MFPSFVGSKKMWIPKILETIPDLSDREIIEAFCGSASISFGVQPKKIYLYDIDPIIITYISEFDEIVVPEVFTREDYYKHRKDAEWWKYIYCFQSMSFSGVFRYSKNGYNVPAKKNIEEVRCREQYLKDLEIWKPLHMEINQTSYKRIPEAQMQDNVLILDPPYEGSQASYNTNKFDYKEYWEWVDKIKHLPSHLIIFDRKSNLEKQGFTDIHTRKMTVNGKYAGDIEGMVIIC